MRPMLTSLDHVIVGVRDLGEATRSTARLLGRQATWHGEHPGAGTANSLFRLDNTYLELLAPHGSGPIGGALAARLEQRGEGIVGLAFGTPDADACEQELAARGLEPAPPEEGLGRDIESGAFRRWRRVALPLERTRGVLLFAIEHTSPDDLLPHSPAGGPEAGCVAALDHVVVQSPDPEAAKALYGDGLGIRLALDREFPDWGVRLLFFRVGGVTVEVAAQLDAAGGEQDLAWGLSYRVPDADAARARLLEAGIDVSEVRKGRKPGTRVFSVKDGSLGIPTLMLEPAA